MNSLTYSKEVPIKYEVDVLVIGGSQSGVAAAVAAKRTNPDAEVMLIEQFGYLGGQSIGTMVIHYEQREYTNNKGQIIAKGLGKEMIKRCVEKGNSDALFQEWLDGKGPPYPNVVDQRAMGDVPLDLEDLKLTFQEMCDEAGVKVKLFTKLVDVFTELSPESSFPSPTHVIVADMNGLSAIKAKQFVDCTANNDISYFIGSDNIATSDQDVMPMQTYAWFGGVAIVKFVNAFWEHPEGWQIIYPNNKEQMLQHIYEGKVIMMRGGADYLDAAEEKYPGIMKELEKFCAPIVYYWVKVLRVFPIQIGDTTYYDSIWAIEGPISRESQIDPEIVSKFQQTQLRAVNIMQKIHSLMPGWENCYIARTADRTGFRRTRFLKGVYQLKEWDIKNAAVFEDVVGRGSGHDISRRDPKWEIGYDIPYRALIPAHIDNLLVGGRSISCDPEEHTLTALNAHRGIQSTIVCSEAAGTAAALCVKNDVTPRNLNCIRTSRCITLTRCSLGKT